MHLISSAKKKNKIAIPKLFGLTLWFIKLKNALFYGLFFVVSVQQVLISN